MQELKQFVKEQYSIDTDDIKAAVELLQEHECDISAILSYLDLDSYLDFVDDFFANNVVIFQAEVVAHLFWHLENSFELYQALLKENNQVASEATAEDFLAPDYAAVAECASGLCMHDNLTDGAADVLYDGLCAYNATRRYSRSFWLKFAYQFVLREHKLANYQRIDKILEEFADIAKEVDSSHHLQFCVVLCSFNYSAESEYNQIVVRTSCKSRDWLLCTCAAALYVKSDGFDVNMMLWHEILAYGTKISDGLARMVNELGYGEGDEDCGPAVFTQFLIGCVTEARVARLACKNEPLLSWLDTMMQDGDMRKNELARAVGRALLRRVGDECEQKAQIMKIMSGRSTNAGTSVRAEARM